MNIENKRRLYAFSQYLKEKPAAEAVASFRFITHSMGGRVFSCYLNELKGNYSDLDKVILCAPPFRGSPYARIHMVKGDGGWKGILNSVFGRNEDIRKVVRTFPSVFELLPWYDHSICFDDYNEPVDLQNIDHWQSNLIDDDKAMFGRGLADLKKFRSKGMMNLAKLPQDVKDRIMILA